MIPGKYKIEMWRGSTWSINIQQNTLDFTSYDEIRMQIRPSFIKGTPTRSALLELTLDNGRISLENGNQTLKLTVSATDTQNLTFDEGVYDLELVNYTEGTVDKLLYGPVEIHGEYTV